jgi:hypothetical protein
LVRDLRLIDKLTFAHDALDFVVTASDAVLKLASLEWQAPDDLTRLNAFVVAKAAW